MASRWRKWYAYLETIWNLGYGIFLGKNKSTIVRPRPRCNLFTQSNLVCHLNAWSCQWRDPVGLRGCGVFWHRQVHCVGEDRPWWFLRATYGRCSKKPSQNFVRFPPEDTIHFLRHTASKTTCLIVRLCKSDTASTAGSDYFDVEKKVLLRTQTEVKWHVITLHEAIEYVPRDSLQRMRDFPQQRHLNLMLSPFTFLKPGAIYLFKWWKEGNEGWIMQGVLSRASFHRPPLAARKLAVLSLPTSHIYHHKTGFCNKKVHLHDPCHHDWSTDGFCCMWFQWDSVAVSTIEKAFADCSLPTPLGPHHCGDPDRFQTTGVTCVVSSNSLIHIGLGRCDFMVLSPSHAKLGLRPTDESCHHETWLHLDFVNCRKTQSHHDEYDRRFYSKSALRCTRTASSKGAPAISWATIHSLRDRAIIRTRSSILCEKCRSSRSELMTLRAPIH